MMPGILAGDGSLALFTDLYELSMLQAYRREGLAAPAVFSLFARRLPPQRNYLLACGLDDALRYLETVRFTEADIETLRRLGGFGDEFLDWLRGFRFTGDVYAVAEGTPVFAQEPILEVVAPIAEAQLAETFILNQVHLQTVLASKASRVVRAAAGRTVVDFGVRRMHGVDAGMKAARAFHIAGVAATSNVLGGVVYGAPVTGTMAHSYVQAHDTEQQAFRAFSALYPQTILLVDTYDTLDGVRRVIDLAREMGEAFAVRGVRLDSGDLLQLSREARALLDEAGLTTVEIFASGGLDEYEIARLVRAGAPITGFGVGTRMGVSADAPALDMAYKLTEYAGSGRMKLSAGKRLLPGRKQVFRRLDAGGMAEGDVLARGGEQLEGSPLLELVMRNGRRLDAGRVSPAQARSRARAELRRMPQRILDIEPADPGYPVELSEALQAEARAVEERVRAGVEGIG